MGSVLTAVLWLAALAAVTLPFVLLGCKIGDGVEWIMNKILKLN